MIGSEFVELHLDDLQRVSVRACEINFIADNIEVRKNANDEIISREVCGSIVSFGGRTISVNETYEDVLYMAKEAEM